MNVCFEFGALFPHLFSQRKEREISKAGKNRGLESCSNIFFPLVLKYVSKVQTSDELPNPVRFLFKFVKNHFLIQKIWFPFLL